MLANSWPGNSRRRARSTADLSCGSYSVVPGHRFSDAKTQVVFNGVNGAVHRLAQLLAISTRKFRQDKGSRIRDFVVWIDAEPQSWEVLCAQSPDHRLQSVMAA